MKNWCFHSVAALLSGLLLLAVGCKKSADETAAGDQVIKVGEFASLTGKEAAFGQSSHRGTQLAVNDLNAAGGVLGKQVSLITEDDLSKAGEAATIVRKLISRDNVIAVLGEVASSRSLEGADICQQYHIPMISPSSTNPKVTEKGDYIFRVCFTDPFQGKLLANFVANDLKAKNVAILTDVASAYSVGLADFFKAPFVAGGGTIVAEQKYSGGDKDFKAQLTAIKALNPDAIFVPGYYGEAGLICQQARQLGVKIPIVGGDGWEAPELIEIGKDAMEGTYFSTHYSSENQDPKIQDFVKRYREKNGGQTPDAMSALGYDSMMVLAEAIKRVGGAAEPQLRDAIAATKDYDGLTGKTTLDADRNATKSAVIITIENGKFKYLENDQPLTEFLQQLINGLSLGAIYALIALGYTMVYGVLRFINFAHSDVFMVGAFSGFYLAKYFPAQSLGGGLIVLAGAMLICAALGIVIERLAYRPLRNRSKLNVLITAIGVSLLLENAGQHFFGADPKPFPVLFPVRELTFGGGLVVSSNQLAVFIITIILLVALQFIVLRTRIGTAMRAVSFNPIAASLVGINLDIVISFTFGLGSMLAGAGGILYSLNYQSIDPLMGILPGLKAFVAAVLGGIGNIPGAALGGLLLGIIEAFCNGTRFSTWTDAIAFTLLILILLFRPAGLLGKFQVEKV